MQNLEYLENNPRITHEQVRRLSFNKRLIGKKVFSITYGGWYGHVRDMGSHIDEFMVERPNRKVFPVDIYDIRQIDDHMEINTSKTTDMFKDVKE